MLSSTFVGDLPRDGVCLCIFILPISSRGRWAADTLCFRTCDWVGRLDNGPEGATGSLLAVCCCPGGLLGAPTVSDKGSCGLSPLTSSCCDRGKVVIDSAGTNCSGAGIVLENEYFLLVYEAGVDGRWTPLYDVAGLAGRDHGPEAPANV